MKVLIGCEYSGTMRDAFIAKGHTALSCDLLPTEASGPHYQGDIRDVIESREHFDLFIVHPECTFLSSSGLHWNKNPKSARFGGWQTEESLEFVRYLLNCRFEKIALENPVGCISTRVRKPDQIIQPHEFGDDASKATCLWLKGLPILQSTLNFPPRIVEHPKGSGRLVKRWSNQTDGGQNKLGPSADRWKLRSDTYKGIALAAADQWG